MKVNKSLLIGLILVLLMLSSTLIYFIQPILQAIFQPSLPEGNVVDFELDVSQKNLVLRQGKVLLEFFYGKACLDCQEKISFLDFLANQYKNQTFLEKINVNESIPRLNIIGFNVTQDKVYLDERYLVGNNITEGNVKDTLCDVMILPPLECAKI